MNFKQISLLFIVLIFATASFAEPSSPLRQNHDKPSSKHQKYAKPSSYSKRSSPVAIIAYRTKLQTIPTNIELVGILKSNLAVDITSNVSDIITSLQVKETDFVKKGQTLFRLNDDEQQAILAQQKIISAQAKLQYKRVKKLAGRGAITQATIDDKYSQWQTAIAEQNIIKTRINQRIIKAPFSGQLGFSDLTVGSFVKSGDKIISLYQNNKMKLELLIPSKYIKNIQLNQTLNISSSSFPKHNFKATIQAISPSVQTNLHMLKIRAIIENPDNLLKNNMLVNANLALPVQQQILIPNTAILMLGDKKFVYKLVKNIEKSTEQKPLYNLKKLEIMTAERGAKTIHVVEGLTENSLIVSQGLLKVSPRTIVSVKEIQD